MADILALISLIVAFLSFGISIAAYFHSKKQEERKLPMLIPSLVDGYFQYCGKEQDRIFVFQLSISNHSDSDNSVAEIELHITYEVLNETLVTTRITSNTSIKCAVKNVLNSPNLSTPARIDAHQTLSGWCAFNATSDVLRDAKIEGYEIVIFDSHNIRTSVKPILVREIQK